MNKKKQPDFNAWRLSCDIRHLRIEVKKLSIRDAAAEIGISFPTLSRVEGCKMPDLFTYYLICQWLEVSLNYYFD